MEQYKALVKHVLENGRRKEDRTGTGTISVFGAQMRFDLTKGFPLNTLKATPLYLIADELAWFLSGSTDDHALATLNRISREAAKMAKAFAKAGEEGQLTLMQFFAGCVPRDMIISPDKAPGVTFDKLLTEYGMSYPQYREYDGPLTLAVIGSVIRFLVSKDMYVWLYELEDKPTIWDEWATYNSHSSNNQLQWVIDRSLDDPEVTTEVEVIRYTYELHEGSVVEKQKWLHDEVVKLSAKYQVDVAEYANKRTIGPMYGKQWRAFGEFEIDQIESAVETLRSNPTSRRICVSAWDAGYTPIESISPHENVDRGDMALAPCHAFFQFNAEELTIAELLELPSVQSEIAYCAPEVMYSYIRDKQLQGKIPRYRLSCQVYCRSQDLFLGTPFNIASYALLTHLIAAEVGMVVGELVWTGGDVHLYSNHLDQVKEMLSRDCVELPKLILHSSGGSYVDLQSTDLELVGYNPHPTISAPVAI